MKTEIKVPAMGESIQEATISVIIKQSGSDVKVDDEILELETDKVNQVLFAPQTGKITISVSEGDVVKIGQVIGFVESEKQTAIQNDKKSEEIKPELKKEELLKEKPKEEKPNLVSIKSSARLSKKEAVADLSNKETATPKEMPKVLSHTMGKSDINKPRDETRKKMTKIRRVIATRLVQAQHETAMLTTFNEVDMSEIMGLRERYKDLFMKEHGVKLGFMSFFVKAAVAALEAFPIVNSYIDGDDIVERHYFDIGIAVGTDRGLVVPVIRHGDTLTFSAIEAEIESYAKKARDGGLTVDDLTGGGFTITNGGVYGSLLSTPILNRPQSAILGMHKIMKRAVVVDDQIVIRQMMYLALSYDHRIIDGKEAVSFLVMIKNMLEDPARLLLEL